MQALSVAISPAGVQFLAQRIVVSQLTSLLGTLGPADRTIPIPDFGTDVNGTAYWNVSIALTNGSLSGFAPAFTSLAQATPPAGVPGSRFTLVLTAPPFSAGYTWTENYRSNTCYTGGGCHGGSGPATMGYGPGFASMATTVVLAFVYDAPSATWDIDLVGTPVTAVTGAQANIPGSSILQNEDQRCFSSNVSDATADAVSRIDFGGLVSTLFPPVLHSIPASGHLTADITFDFAVGDAGLTFPGQAGIAAGVTGAVTYKGTTYAGTPPAALPLPPPPPDAHHVQVYVSSYEVDALLWAFYEAGALTVTATPGDIPDPDALKCKTYALVPGFKPYAALGMTAHITPKAAPTVTFGDTWLLTQAVEDVLRTKLPADVFAKVDSTGMLGNVYVDRARLEADLTANAVAPTWFATIESAAHAGNLVVVQDLLLHLTIDTPQAPHPTLEFEVQRTDILSGLSLGVAGTAQTMQFVPATAGFTATFVATTIPGFDTHDFADMIWPTVGEPEYELTMAALGKAGVPVPIMTGFEFVFEEAVVSVQEGYVSVLANVRVSGS